MLAIEHLLDIKRREAIRANKRKLNQQQRSEKKLYSSYIWEELTVNGGINKLTVSELKKYLSHHNLPKYGKKIDKIKRISCHLCRSNSGREKVQSLVAAQQPRIERSSNGDTNSDVSSSDSEDEVRNLAAQMTHLVTSYSLRLLHTVAEWQAPGKMLLFKLN